MGPQTGAAIAGAIFVLANVLVFWIREWLKNKTWRKNGKDLVEIKDDIKVCAQKLTCMDDKLGKTREKVAEIKTAVSAQKTQCAATIQRFDKAIGDQGQTIISLAKNSGRRR